MSRVFGQRHNSRNEFLAIIMNIGTEWLVDAEGCSAKLLSDLQTIRLLCQQIIHDLDLRVVGDGVWHKFPHPGGVTGLFLLTESHLACHTYPEAGMATFNLYCCQPRPDWQWEDRLIESLGASRVTVRIARRGASVEGEGASLEEKFMKRATSEREGRNR
jgi:S-adenosylmethionine decarboxylase